MLFCKGYGTIFFTMRALVFLRSFFFKEMGIISITLLIEKYLVLLLIIAFNIIACRAVQHTCITQCPNLGMFL